MAAAECSSGIELRPITEPTMIASLRVQVPLYNTQVCAQTTVSLKNDIKSMLYKFVQSRYLNIIFAVFGVYMGNACGDSLIKVILAGKIACVSHKPCKYNIQIPRLYSIINKYSHHTEAVKILS
jgi:hypothetical protein